LALTASDAGGSPGARRAPDPVRRGAPAHPRACERDHDLGVVRLRLAVVDARVGSMKVSTLEVPADVDPRAEEWTSPIELTLPPGEDLILFVKNTGDRAARYRSRFR